MKQNRYTFELSHDNGTVVISTYAFSENEAKKKISESENCPESALKLIGVQY